MAGTGPAWADRQDVEALLSGNDAVDAASVVALIRATNTVCQYHRLLKLVSKGSKSRDLTGQVVVMIPRSLQSAAIMFQNPDGLYVPFRPEELRGFGEVKEIQYSLTAWNDDTVVQEYFRHPIEHKLLLNTDRGLHRQQTNLFIRVALNDVLGTRKFPGAKGLQFIC